MSMEADSLAFADAAAGGDDDDSSDDESGLSPSVLASRRQRRPSAQQGSSALKIGRSNFLHRIDLAEFTSSSKLDALIDAIVDVKKKSPDHKSIVFSQ